MLRNSDLVPMDRQKPRLASAVCVNYTLSVEQAVNHRTRIRIPADFSQISDNIGKIPVLIN